MEYLSYKFKIAIDSENIDDSLINLESICNESQSFTKSNLDYLKKLKKTIIKKSKKSLDSLINIIQENKEIEESKNIRKAQRGSIQSNAYNAYDKYDDNYTLERNINNLLNQSESINITSNSKIALFKNFALLQIKKNTEMIDKFLLLLNTLINNTNNELNHQGEEEENDDVHEHIVEKLIFLLNIKASLLNHLSNYTENKSKQIQTAYYTYLQAIELCLLHLSTRNIIGLRLKYSYMKYICFKLKDPYRAFLFMSELKSQIEEYQSDNLINYITNKINNFHDNNIELFKQKYRVYFPKLKNDIF